jgi:hypothetical protein
MARKQPSTFRLIEDAISRETVKALEELLSDARSGRIIGIGFVAMYRRREYIANTAGECRRNPTFTRGMLRVLDDKVARAISSMPP